MAAGVVLAIETSQRLGSVAITRTDGGVDHEPLRATARHEDDLMPAIDRLCRRSSIAPGDIAAIGVSIGPGGFTGLRIAVSTTKMLAESLGARIAAVPSALVAAEPIEAPGPTLVCLASKGETTWVTRLQREDSHWAFVGEPALALAADLDLAGIETVVADEFLPDTLRKRIEAAGRTVVAPLFDARACLAAAKRMLTAGRTTDSLSLAPIYARPPEAVRLWEKARRDERT
jgi:tRNA threonylcarbamoyl adenosine modification protein YeaZ